MSNSASSSGMAGRRSASSASSSSPDGLDPLSPVALLALPSRLDPREDEVDDVSGYAHSRFPLRQPDMSQYGIRPFKDGRHTIACRAFLVTLAASQRGLQRRYGMIVPSLVVVYKCNIHFGFVGASRARLSPTACVGHAVSLVTRHSLSDLDPTAPESFRCYREQKCADGGALAGKDPGAVVA